MEYGSIKQMLLRSLIYHVRMQVDSTEKFVGNNKIGDDGVDLILESLSQRSGPRLDALALTGKLYLNIFGLLVQKLESQKLKSKNLNSFCQRWLTCIY